MAKAAHPPGSATIRETMHAARILAWVDMAEILDRLYGLDPTEFTAARDAAAGEARKAGDRATADAIRALHRPSPAAWAVNQLVREHGDELHGLLELGDRLREAQASLSADDLRQLSRQRQEVVAALAREAVALAAARSRPISDAGARQVEETLVAALADPHAAAAVASGRLERTLDYSGFGPVDVQQAVAGPLPAREPAPVGKKATGKRTAGQAGAGGKKAADGPDPQLEAAEEEVGRTAAAVEQARDELASTESAVETAEEEQAAGESEVARLEEQLGAARRELVAAKGRTRAAAKSRSTAENALAAAERQAGAAAERLEKLRRRKD